ncbi:unnamed protein product [Auanema sp. JU1783]|nr:unnamed protein product [Auanema sp. JU1783]
MSTDELVSSLSCTELLADSPSTSRNQQRSENRRRSNRIVLQPVTNKVLGSAVVSRKRTSADSRLNTAQHVAVGTLSDKALAADTRVLANLRIAETMTTVNSHYFTSVQDHVQPIHREQAIEWIYDVSKEERCDADIFPLAVSLMDRFLSIQNIFKTDIQVLAGVCLFIASKVKAPQPLNAQRMSYYTADSVQVHDFLAWELLVLSQLDWDINCPTAFDFFDQLAAHVPSLALVKDDFTSVVHKIQKNVKLGMMLPSIQCALSLVYAAERFANQSLVNELARILPMTLGMEMKILKGFSPLLERAISDGSHTLAASPCAPPTSCRTPSPSMAACPFVPATPNNDSGFCSGVSSPESACKKDLDCSPPKHARLSC